MKAIDVHVHYPIGGDPLKRLVEGCEKAEISMVWLQSLGRFRGVDENRLIEEAFHEYPDLFKGFGFVHLGIDDPRVVDDLYSRGFTGLKIIKPLKPYDSDEFFPYYERAEKYRMPILFHTGIVARDPADREYRVSSDFMRPICLDRIARSFPNLIIIGAHLGHPWCDEAAVLMMHNPNLYFDICGGHTFWIALTLKNRIRYDADPNRLLYATDTTPENFLRYKNFWEVALPQIGFTRDEIQSIFYGNAERILKNIKG